MRIGENMGDGWEDGWEDGILGWLKDDELEWGFRFRFGLLLFYEKGWVVMMDSWMICWLDVDFFIGFENN